MPAVGQSASPGVKLQLSHGVKLQFSAVAERGRVPRASCLVLAGVRRWTASARQLPTAREPATGWCAWPPRCARARKHRPNAASSATPHYTTSHRPGPHPPRRLHSSGLGCSTPRPPAPPHLPAAFARAQSCPPPTEALFPALTTTGVCALFNLVPRTSWRCGRKSSRGVRKRSDPMCGE